MTSFQSLALALLALVCLVQQQPSFQVQAFVRPSTATATHNSRNNHPRRTPARLQAAPKALSRSGKPVLLACWTAVKHAVRELTQMTRTQKAWLLAAVLLGVALGKVQPFWQRIESIQQLSPAYFGPTAPVLTGRAVRITDGDTFRFLHTPTRFSRKELIPKQEKASEVALPIRICSMDTPETAKFGKKGQPFGQEAKEKLASLLEGKPVYVRLLQGDQYGRGVAEVFVKSPMGRKRFVDEVMLKEGLAEVYQGGGAVYGRLGLEGCLRVQEGAQQEKKGIWSLDNRESAAEYKRRTKS